MATALRLRPPGQAGSQLMRLEARREPPAIADVVGCEPRQKVARCGGRQGVWRSEGAEWARSPSGRSVSIVQDHVKIQPE
jgi:hypothetical protein